MNKILIPIDGSEYAQRAMEKGVELAKCFGSQIILLNVEYFTMPYVDYELETDIINSLSKNSKETLNKGVEFMNNHNINVKSVSLHGETATTIINFINEKDVDLVIMGSHGLSAGPIEGLLIGSIANKVLHKTKKPIMIVK